MCWALKVVVQRQHGLALQMTIPCLPAARLVRGNTLLLSDDALRDLFRTIATTAEIDFDTVGAAFAGCARPSEQARVEKNPARRVSQGKTRLRHGGHALHSCGGIW